MFKNASVNIKESVKKKFIELFALQMFVVWSLQKKGLFNNDKSYFITKFNEIKLFNTHKTYWEYLGELFTKIITNKNQLYFEDKYFGKIINICPAIIIEEYLPIWLEVSIPDNCFYQNNYPSSFIINKNRYDVSELPLLNLFQTKDWNIENVTGFVFGTIYEQLFNVNERKGSGSYYTPELISQYICKKIFESYIVDKLITKYAINTLSIDEFIENASQEKLSDFIFLLKDMKVLDPAVGSGHFLETAIKELLAIYEKLWLKVKANGIKSSLEVQLFNDQGTKIPVNLFEVTSIEHFRFLVIFYLLIPNTIYGTDINVKTLNIAKARLFLILADLFVQSDNILLISNIKFNLYKGNAIFGQKKLEIPETTLMDSKYQKEILNRYTELLFEFWKSIDNKDAFQNFLLHALPSLGYEESLTKLVFTPICYEDNLISQLLTFNYMLTKIINLSFTTSYFHILLELSIRIKMFLQDIVTNEFGNVNKFDPKKVLLSKPIFWSCIFPEVFLSTDPGFNIIIGNPPYGAKLLDIEKVWLRKEFISVKGIELADNHHKKKLLGDTNTAIAFTELAEHLSNRESKVGLVVPKSILYVKSWQSLRCFLMNNTHLDAIIDINKAFNKVKLEEIIIFYSKLNVQKKDFVLCGKLTTTAENIELIKVDRKYFSLERFLISMNHENEHIYNSIMNTTIELGKICNNKRGSENNKFKRDQQFSNAIPVLDGKNIQPYYIRSRSYILAEHIKDKSYYKYNTVIIQRIIAHVKRPLPHIVIAATLNPGYPNVNTVVNIYSYPNQIIRPKVLALLLNSEITNWYIYLFIFSEAIRSMDLWGTYLDQVRIPDILNTNNYVYIEKIFEILSLYTTYVSRTGKNLKEDKEIIDYFKELTNLIAYEIYLRKELHTHLLEVLQKLNLNLEIDFDTWYQFEQFNMVDTWLTHIEKIKLLYYQIKDIKELENEKNSINIHPTVKYIRKNFI